MTDKRDDESDIKTNSRVNVPLESKDEDFIPEGGWGWMIVISLFLFLTVCFGFVFSLSVFFVEWIQYFDATATEISWVTSMIPAILGTLSPVAGVLCTRFGSRKVTLVGSAFVFLGVLLAVFAETVLHLFITVALIPGIGLSLAFTPTLVLLGHYFQKRYVLANSIAFCGYSFGQMAMPRLAQLLLEVYGWRGALLVLTAISANLFVCAALLRPRARQKLSKNSTHGPKLETVSNSSKDQKIWTSRASIHIFNSFRNKLTSLEDKQETPAKPEVTRNERAFWKMVKSNINVLRKIKFVLILVSVFAANIGWFAIFGHLVAHAVRVGISHNNAAFLQTAIGIGSLVGRAGHGIIIDKGIINREVMFILSFGITGILTFINLFLRTFPSLCIFALLFGVGHGIANTLVYAMLKLQVATSEAAAAISFALLVLGVTSVMGVVLAGWLFDKTGNYDASFYFAGATILTGTLILAVMYVTNYRKKKVLKLRKAATASEYINEIVKPKNDNLGK